MEETRTYSIKKVANMVGDPKYKLRHWCDRYLPKIRKIDNRKGSPATIILHYVFNELRNIERSCARGTFDKAHKNCDAMDRVGLPLRGSGQRRQLDTRTHRLRESRNFTHRSGNSGSATRPIGRA